MSIDFKTFPVGFVIGLLVAAIAAYFCYQKGFEHGTAEAAARQAKAIEIAQNEVIESYERRMQNLSASLERVRSDNALRMRQLEDFNNTRTNLATCRRDRSRLARLAVRGEELLQRADSYLGAFVER